MLEENLILLPVITKIWDDALTETQHLRAT